MFVRLKKLTRNHTGDGGITQVKVAVRGTLFARSGNIQRSLARNVQQIIRSGTL
ncbi:hypothetical protein [Erwinia endophytica]|uniref:hypothetical protein n=1 Tax=Erwinia endophytica TaxID=1563158 RepID=UPI00186B768B|nr:hypothetical protein [Erwinia endophytica]